MMQKLWQKKLKLNYSKNVLDIVQFGSSIYSETANDIDIAVFFSAIPLKEQLSEAQEIKIQIQKEISIPVHINVFDFYSFFNKGNFAKEGILFLGKSIIYARNFSEIFGIVPKMRIYYNLSKLEKKEKVKFNYLLNGKQGSYGLLREYGGEIVSPGVVEVLPEYEKLFLEKMQKISKDLEVEKIFEQNG